MTPKLAAATLALCLGAASAAHAADCLYPLSSKQPARCLTATGAKATAGACEYCRADSVDQPPVAVARPAQGIDFTALTTCMSVTVLMRKTGVPQPVKVAGHFHMLGRASRKARSDFGKATLSASATKTFSVMKTKIGEQAGFAARSIVIAGVAYLWAPHFSPATDAANLLDDKHAEACAYVHTQLGLGANVACTVTTFEDSTRVTIDPAGQLHH